MDSALNIGPFIEKRDLGVTAIVGLLALAAQCLPERRWPAVAGRVARWRLGRRKPLTAEELATIRVLVGNRPAEWIGRDYLPELLGHRYLSWLRLLACYPPRNWRPGARLEGVDNLDAALAAGKGAILWATTFAYNDLYTKAALTEAGYRPHLLSQPSHGFAASRFGQRFLNPIYLRIEQRYLGDNIVIEAGDTASALTRVKQRLADNGVVVIYALPLGRRIATRPFLDGVVNLATGALNLGCETGAAVVPVFTTAGADGQVTTSLAPALPWAADQPRADAIETMLDHYIPELEHHARACPAQLAFPLKPADGRLLIAPCAPPSKGSGEALSASSSDA